MNQTEIIKLKKKGYSQKEIAEKLNISQQDVSYQLRKAKNDGIFDGQEGEEFAEWDLQLEENSEEEKKPKKITLEGKKPKLKGSFKCSRCHKPLIPIEEVTFKPSKLGTMLKEHGYSHVCIDCKIAFSRESTGTAKEYSCPECKTELFKIVDNKKFLGYWCNKCEILYEKGDKILRKKQAKKEVEK